jgi:hypothetical protein
MLPPAPVCFLFDFCCYVCCHLLLYVFCLTSVFRFVTTCSYMFSVCLLFLGLLPPNRKHIGAGGNKPTNRSQTEHI